MYAIRNKITMKWVYGTDYRYNPPRQRTSNRQALTFSDLNDVKHQFKHRCCGKDYEIVEVELKEVDE